MSEHATDGAGALPAPLADVIADLEFVDRGLRMELLIEFADRFTDVPPSIASRPFPEVNRAPRCESDAFVFVTDRPDGTFDLHFAVENPQGLSAKAWAVIMADTLSGQPLERVAAVPQDVIFKIFGKDLSMGKGQGLVGMLELAQHEARRRLTDRRKRKAGLD